MVSARLSFNRVGLGEQTYRMTFADLYVTLWLAFIHVCAGLSANLFMVNILQQ